MTLTVKLPGDDDEADVKTCRMLDVQLVSSEASTPESSYSCDIMSPPPLGMDLAELVY